MGCKPNWTAEEMEYLEDKWGTRVSIPAIAKKLGRSVMGVKLKAQRMKLGAKLEAGDWITFNQLLQAITGANAGIGYTAISYIKRRNLPVKMVKVNNSSFRVVSIKDFWEWADKNRAFIDFSKFEPYILGDEPKWVAAQRKADSLARAVIKTTKWTPIEDDRLRHLMDMNKTYQEMADDLQRTQGAVVRRCGDLGLGRARKVSPHSSKWTRDDLRRLKEMILDCTPWVLIAKDIGKTEKACRGRAGAIWGSENLDRLRVLIPAKEQRFDDVLYGRVSLYERQRKSSAALCGGD